MSYLKRVNCKSKLVKLQVHNSPMRSSMMLLIQVTMTLSLGSTALRRAFGWMQMREVHLGKCQQTLLEALISQKANLKEVNRPLSPQRLAWCLMRTGRWAYRDSMACSTSSCSECAKSFGRTWRSSAEPESFYGGRGRTWRLLDVVFSKGCWACFVAVGVDDPALGPQQLLEQ